MRNAPLVSFFILAAGLVGGCGEKKVVEQTTAAPPPPPYDCEAENIKAEVLGDLSRRLVAGGAKGNTASTLQSSLSIIKINPIEKDPRTGYSKCLAVVQISYSNDLASKVGKSFSTFGEYHSFRDKLESRYGVVAGSGIIMQLLEAAADGPFGNVPLAPDPESIGRYAETIKRNLEVVISEKTPIVVSYQVQLDVNPNGKTVHELKTQLDGELAFDLNVSLLSASNILFN